MSHSAQYMAFQWEMSSTSWEPHENLERLIVLMLADSRKTSLLLVVFHVVVKRCSK